MSQSEPKAFQSFEEFWPFYVREHANRTNRMLHFVGTTLATASFVAGLATKQRKLLLAAPVLGYGLAWIGHFLVEGNKPATFRHPLWSLRGDYRMWLKIVTGAMEAEVDAVTRTSNGASHDADPIPAATAAGSEAAN
jgi:hypothetical protein